MSFTESISTVFKKYFDFTGRARRREYWFFCLFYTLVMIFLGVVEPIIFSIYGLEAYSFLFIWYLLDLAITLIFALPTIALTTRRLHDTGRSGWWQLIWLTGIGAFVLLYWMIKGSDDGDNKYGQRQY